VFQWINDDLHSFWRAIDEHVVVLDILAQVRWNASAAP
jgi:hypothetical protein